MGKPRRVTPASLPGETSAEERAAGAATAIATLRPDNARQGPTGGSCLFIKFLFQTLKLIF